ncbi:hypothetical protein [Cohnella silvisoli]|uniref:DUF948 domain-containing protein n=1 Tax=Cohnella silvisoli TaxID=2873699 RepID=A0ABV1KU49_9BACL|nr:hypothetical protein [Cohnella silvisoli]MCD9023186.1 hypothetical protein [Cohnella silvisoli]
MAWDIAAYGITAAVLAIAAACVIGIAKICRSLSRLDATVKVLGKETEVSLRQCAKLADEASDAIAVSRQSLQGFATLAEGARALGEAVQAAAQTAAHVTVLCRERLTSLSPVPSEHRDQTACELPDLTELGRNLWSLWRRRTGNGQSSSESCQSSPGPSADPSQGE